MGDSFMRKRLIHLAAALLAAAILLPADAFARPGGPGGGGGGGGGRGFSGGMGGGGGFAARSFSGGGGGFAARSFSGPGMRGGFTTSRAFVGGNPGFAGSGRSFVGGSRFVGSSRFAGNRFHRFHGRRFIGPAFAFGAGLGAYAYDPYWYGYYDDDCVRLVNDWYGWRYVNVCY
jgi:hypothetical protein